MFVFRHARSLDTRSRGGSFIQRVFTSTPGAPPFWNGRARGGRHARGDAQGGRLRHHPSKSAPRSGRHRGPADTCAASEVSRSRRRGPGPRRLFFSIVWSRRGGHTVGSTTGQASFISGQSAEWCRSASRKRACNHSRLRASRGAPTKLHAAGSEAGRAAARLQTTHSRYMRRFSAATRQGGASSDAGWLGSQPAISSKRAL